MLNPGPCRWSLCIPLLPVLAALPAEAEPLHSRADLVLVGSIESVEARELPPCPPQERAQPAVPARCGTVLRAQVRPEAFFSGAWRDRLQILLPRLPGDPDLVGAHAVLFLEKHGGELWVAGGHEGLLVSREPFAAAAIDRLRVALALTGPPAGGKEEDAVMVDPQAGVSMPVNLRRTRPTFPDAAREAGLCGRVLLSGIVGTNGKISSLRVLKAPHPGYGFEAAAVRSVSEWEYEPSTKDGQPVAVFLTVGVDFTLAGVCAQPGSGQPVPAGALVSGPQAVEDALAGLTQVSLQPGGRDEAGQQ